MNQIENLIFEFKRLQELAEMGMDQISDYDFFLNSSKTNNSIAIITKHIGGNLKSRFCNFLTTDGEKPNRNRDQEFEITSVDTRDSIMSLWQSGWNTLFDSLDQLQIADLSKTVLIRGEKHLVNQALNRSLTHIAYHVGQIVLLCKQIAGDSWKTLSVARGKSESFRKKPSSYNN